VTREEPAEAHRGQPRNGPQLSGPVEPANMPVGDEAAASRIPSQVIAAEEVFAVMEDAVAAGVTGRRDDGAVADGHRIIAFDHDIGIGLRAAVALMDDSARTEMRGVASGVGDVVAVREKNRVDAAARRARAQARHSSAVHRSANFPDWCAINSYSHRTIRGR